MRTPLSAMCLALLWAGKALAAPTIALPPGVGQEFDIPAASSTDSFYVEVPEGGQTLRVDLKALNATPGGQLPDLDLLLRHGSPISGCGPASVGLDPECLFDQAQYRGASAGGEEFIIVSAASQIPLRAGRWYLTVLNFDAQNPTRARITASLQNQLQVEPIQVLFDSTGSPGDACDANAWNDASPRAPVGGNTGTTLGQQRRNAMLEAARLLTLELKPSVPIRINACWQDLGPTGSDTQRYTLAQAGPADFHLADVGAGSHTPALPQRYTLYAAAPVAVRAGTSFCGVIGGSCSEPEVFATFNNKLDQPNSGLSPFDYGTVVVGSTSFVAVAMHEIVHGLGFLGLVNLTSSPGARLSRYDDIYGRHARWAPTGAAQARPFLRLTDAERLLALTSDTGNRNTPGSLYFGGPLTVAGDVFAASQQCEPSTPRLRPLHAPAPIESGSTYSHVNECYFSQLMLAVSRPTQLDLGLGRNMLYDLGWDPSPKAAAQFSLPPDLQYYDPARSGHGIDLRRVAGTTDLYFIGFYTYDANGAPEWFTALGRFVDGVFVPARNEFGDSLVRNIYQANQIPRSVVDASAEFEGSIRLDFNQAANSPACLDGNAGRALGGVLAVMSFELPGAGRQQWCLQPVIAPDAAISTNFSSVWYAGPSDGGWGLAVQSLPGAGSDGMAVGVYYADASGKPRWGLAVTSNYQPGQAFDVMQVQGYCRTCPLPASLPQLRIGSIKIGLAAPGGGTAPDNRLTLDVTYPGVEGGRFQRENISILPANEPRYRSN
ncbi:MAG: hypothetical protein LKM32_06495 [Chiayiivirga sp.]|jgi:hypothetical protein|uniref:hypothetical protein n=1 Tax=Chiayiivirga sp. TaxID=2041042 RepID=UPI0025C24E25|nr:hypothetical protein [Chiayiivirga sp.]MCI1729029.1 hypothetical protein [Chiayiivirga sp.]